MKGTIRWRAEAYEEFLRLQEAVAQDLKSSQKPNYPQLLNSIEKTIRNLRENPFYGNLIPRKYLTKEAINRYGTDKIFRIELVGYWRLLYTILGDEAIIIVILLEYFDHKSYDTLFGYKKK